MRYLFVIIMISHIAMADCAHTLTMCNDLVNVQQDQITHLKLEITSLKQALNDEKPSFVPVWGWLLAGFITGGTTVYLIRK